MSVDSNFVQGLLAEGTRPRVDDVQVAVPETQTGESAAQSGEMQGQPGELEAQPEESGNQSETAAGKPSMPEAQPPMPEAASTADTGKPTMEESKPPMDAGKPSMPEATSSMPAGKPSMLPDGLQQRVEALGKKADEEAMRTVIKQLCGWHPHSAEALAALLRRNADYLKTRYLKPMVAQGELALTIPEMPKHPNQAYKTPDA